MVFPEEISPSPDGCGGISSRRVDCRAEIKVNEKLCRNMGARYFYGWEYYRQWQI